MRIHSNTVKKRDFRKLHLASECKHKEKPIYSWELTSAIRRHDSPRFIKLLIRITGELGDVCGDKAYSSRKNAEIAVDRGGRPFLMPRNNASNRAKGHQAWKDMMKYREEHPRAFKNRYNKRSNATESTNSAFKRKFGDILHSRKWKMQKIETGIKVLIYNIRLLIRYRIRTEMELLD
jgi:transposase